MKARYLIALFLIIATANYAIANTDSAPEETPTTTAPIEETTSQAPTWQPLSSHEVELIAKTIWGEARGVHSKTERAAVAWCILNRVDATGKTIEEVITEPHQFIGYDEQSECPQEFRDLAVDVLTRWQAEKNGTENAGRVLPADYLYFTGDGKHNHFTKEWRDGDPYTWTLESPYEN